MSIIGIFHYLCEETDRNTMDQPKVARMLRLMQLLASNVNYSIDELMDKLEMSRRTIYRYIDTFKEAGFAVQKVGSGGTVYKLATLKSSQMDLSKIVYFSDEEAYVVNRLIDRLDDTNTMKQGLKRKLTAVYDATNIGNYVDRKSNSANIEALAEAIREKKVVLLKDYASSHSGTTKNYRVEPFKFNTNYIDFWAYDLAAGMNKCFKVSRIEDVVPLEESWQCEEAHSADPTDVFRMHGGEPVHVRLRLDYVAKNLFVEEYPLAEQGLTPQKDDSWIWEGDIYRMEGAGRFVLGLSDHVRILEGEPLKAFLRNQAQAILSA